jgi:hypothetical protein
MARVHQTAPIRLNKMTLPAEHKVVMDTVRVITAVMGTMAIAAVDAAAPTDVEDLVEAPGAVEAAAALGVLVESPVGSSIR